MNPIPLSVMVVDDEALARARLCTLLGDCHEPAARVVAQAENAVAALQALAHQPCDLALVDIHMPGLSGLELAKALCQLPQPPLVVFVTAHAEHAVQAFEVEALDYLTKPVRRDRLQLALKKAEQALHYRKAIEADLAQNSVLIQERGRMERLPLADVVYAKAELKYVTLRTRERSLVYDGSLSDLEARMGQRWLRIHRNALVARQAIRALEKHHDVDEGDGWAVRLNGVDEALAVSRRQLAAVREALGKE